MGKLKFNKYSTSRLLLGLLFVGTGIFSFIAGELIAGEFSLSSITYNLYELTNIIGFTLIVFGILVIIRALIECGSGIQSLTIISLYNLLGKARKKTS